MNLTKNKKSMRKRAQVIKNSCVACGTCVNACPKGAIKIVAGVFAEVDHNNCVGCSKCFQECPASVIEMVMKDEVN